MRFLCFMLALAALGCDPISVGEPAARGAPIGSTAPTAPGEVGDPGDAPCGSLPRAACLRSLVCTLDAPEGERSRRYRCRDARGNCEIGLAQAGDGAQDRCEDRTGCTWSPGGCYCPCRGDGQTAVPDGDEAPPCDCECGGGPPPGCRAR